MINNFLSKFDVDSSRTPPLIPKTIKGVAEFLELMAGYSWSSGIYRTLSINQQEEWKGIVGEVFDGYGRRVIPFGYDWLGRLFCLDLVRIENNQPLIILLDPSLIKAYEVPYGLVDFYNNVLTNNYEEVLESKLFHKVKTINSVLLETDCYGLVSPEFLGGEFVIENLEIIDIKLYWQLIAQVSSAVNKYPKGTRIKSVRIID
jgi:hypothetical protein